MDRWDKHDPPAKRIGSPAIVQSVSQEVCESGYMVKVLGPSGREVCIDANWLAPLR